MMVAILFVISYNLIAHMGPKETKGWWTLKAFPFVPQQASSTSISSIYLSN
jgi:hypothetical protein